MNFRVLVILTKKTLEETVGIMGLVDLDIQCKKRIRSLSVLSLDKL